VSRKGSALPGGVAGLPELTNRSDLAGYPLLDPRLMMSYDQALLTDGMDSDFVVFSGGTTSGQNKFIHRNFREYRHLAQFRDWWYPRMGYGYAVDKNPADMRLVVVDDQHGIRYIEPRRGPLRLVNLPLAVESHFSVAERVLRARGVDNPDERVVELRGTLHKIQLLTLYAAEHGWKPAEWCAVDRVLTTGSFATRRWRDRFAEVWGARAVQENGQTEFHQSYGTECLDCGSYHFAPIVVPEVVECNDPTCQLDTGTGRLVMTHLVPTALRQVLVRYDTGDLVTKDGLCSVVGQPCYRPLGRIRDMMEISTSDGPLLLAPSHFVDAVDFPEARFDVVDVLQCQGVVGAADIGFPRFRTRLLPERTNRVPAVLLEIELKRDLDTVATNRLRSRVEDRLMIDDERARTLLHVGEFEVVIRFAPPGELRDTIIG
jgi:hypothetical protein